MTSLVDRLRGPIGPFMYQHDRGIALTCEAADKIERDAHVLDARLIGLAEQDGRIEELEAERDGQRDAVEKLTERWGEDVAALKAAREAGEDLLKKCAHKDNLIAELEKERKFVIDQTRKWDEHPEFWDTYCECALCLSYAAEDA